MKIPSEDHRGIIGIIIAVVVVVMIILAVLALVIIPFRSVAIDESRQAPLAPGVDSLELSFAVDAGGVEVRFVDDASTAVSLSVKGHQRSGLLGPSTPANVTWSESTEGNRLIVSSDVKIGGSFGGFTSSDTNCTLLISKQLRTALTLDNALGGVEVTTVDGVDLSSVNIRTSTGGARLAMVPNTTLSGPLNMDASLGGVDLEWTDVRTTENTIVSLAASTGGVKATVIQTEPMSGDVSFAASTSLGGVDLTMQLEGNTSARVLSQANLGDVAVREQTGFNGSSADLASQNYPEASNFEVTCDANTGGVALQLRYISE